MNDSYHPDDTDDAAASPSDSPRASDRLRPLRRVRQYREFTIDPIAEPELDAILDVARWSGSSRNTQPWRFIVIRDVETIRRIAQIGLPQTRSLGTATAAVAITLPADQDHAISHAYDDGRVAERILIAASFLGLGAGIAWVRTDVHDLVREILALSTERIVRTVVALGHPTEAARKPKSLRGKARLSPEELVVKERWPAG